MRRNEFYILSKEGIYCKRGKSNWQLKKFAEYYKNEGQNPFIDQSAFNKSVVDMLKDEKKRFSFSLSRKKH